MNRVRLTVTLQVEVDHDERLVSPGSERLFDPGDVEVPVTALEHHGDAAANEFLDALVRRMDLLGYAPVRVGTRIDLSRANYGEPF